MSDKLNIQNEMRQFDSKNRQFYDELTDEERKKFSNYLMIRWGSSVQGSRELQEFYVLSTNERLNKHFFTINKHPKLQWLCASSVSPGLGSFRHQWIAGPKKAAKNKLATELQDYLPAHKLDDIDCLVAINDEKEIKRWVKDHGTDTK
jgi:hypothetical protein